MDAVEQLLADGFPLMAGSLRPGGSARKVDGGYRVSRRGPGVAVSLTPMPYNLGLPGYVVNEHGCFAYAIGRLALETMIAVAVDNKRGYVGGVTVADREVFQRAVGQGTQRISASRLLMADVIERLFESAQHGPPPAALQAEARAAAVWCTDEALDVVTTMFRYAGGSAVMLDNMMQRCLRDLYTIQSHLVVSDSAYEIHGRLLLGLSTDAPLH